MRDFRKVKLKELTQKCIKQFIAWMMHILPVKGRELFLKQAVSRQDWTEGINQLANKNQF